MLFKNTDFLNPLNSKLFAELKLIQGLEKEVEGLQNACFLNFEEVPKLSDFIIGVYPKAEIIFKIYDKLARSSAYTQIAVSDIEALKQNIGKRIELVGQSTNLYKNIDKRGDEYAFLNFGRYPNQTVQLTFWPRTIMNTIAKIGFNLSHFEYVWLRVIGIPYLSPPNKDGKVYINLDIERLGQIEIIDSVSAENILQKMRNKEHAEVSIKDPNIDPNLVKNWWLQPWIKYI